jgi:pimeloyl-ACP methyl ester carboxylesterase
MPFAANRGVRIHYEVVGEGPAVVLHHGTSGSGLDWIYLGFVDAMKDEYRLLLIDARGHGKSDKPHDPAAYELTLRASDVIAVLDDQQIRRADFLGYSLGGWIGFGLSKYSPGRFSSFVIGAAHPYAENMQPFRDRMPADQPTYALGVDQLFGNLISPAWRARLLANDLEALRALTQDRESIADVLPSITVPCMLFVGELDPRLAQVRQCVSQLPNATFFSLPGWITSAREHEPTLLSRR